MDGLVGASFPVHLNECVSAMYRDARHAAISREKVFQVSLSKISRPCVQVTNEKAATLHVWVVTVSEVLSKALRPITITVAIPRTRPRAHFPTTTRIFLVNSRILIFRIPLIRHLKQTKKVPLCN